ncbi:MAG: hypothetical protein ACFFCZ_16925 [Promethearchaeota archaeon]
MRIKTFNAYNYNWRNKVNPSDVIKINFYGIDEVLQSLAEIRPALIIDYVQAVKKRVAREIQDYHIDSNIFDLQEIVKDFPALKQYPELQELIIQFTCRYLYIPQSLYDNPEPIERFELDIVKSRGIDYHRTKAFADILGRKEGIKLWKEIVVHFVDKLLKGRPESNKESMKDFIEKQLEIKSKDQGADCTVVIFDDNRFLKKVNRCMCHEATKHFNDPEFAYLCYCYIGDVLDSRSKGFRRLRRRRSQTLYFRDFCDEFFWDDEVYPDAQQPSLEFIRKLGKEDPAKIIEEYQKKGE